MSFGAKKILPLVFGFVVLAGLAFTFFLIFSNIEKRQRVVFHPEVKTAPGNISSTTEEAAQNGVIPPRAAGGFEQRAISEEEKNITAEEKKAMGIMPGVEVRALERDSEGRVVAFEYVNLDKLKDTDGDWVTDDEERRLGTDINNPDTDGDGVPDGVEVMISTDPLVKDNKNAK